MNTTLRGRTMLLLASTAALLALTSCGDPVSATDSASDQDAPDSWSFTDTGYGNTITLDERPESLVVDGYSAAALWEYGIRPAGVFGYGITEEDSVAIGAADVSQMTVVGREGEFDLEQLGALEPDLIVGFGDDDGTGWTWWDEQVQSEATRVAPFLGVDFGGRPVQEVIEDYVSLAEALGGDTDSTEAEQAAQDFEERLQVLRDIASDSPDLTLIALNGYDELYVGQSTLGQLALLEELGFTLTGPDADSAWASLSWESVGDYPADVVLSYAGTADQVKDVPAFGRLPAVQAGQVVEWDDKRPFTYASYVEWLDDLIDVLGDARVVSS
ncbi:ABC transporter substrate-binding protein [Nesterenkonia xinjiangensis]|uniref:Iron complex transport system substrate-binding protein n=1 Tax=Nesterenkonia xinjiangensis TaxID=225327 RepID=A0A7Z0GLB1_9MICC|nr:ABC transporter substrate-binding protein [Nesterenkonia xinjiangensis]NYJ77544.1 iron complex transport system substrate-binding protein [Nesterenkonia xinjiangensis]